jgi:hypothetical protein
VVLPAPFGPPTMMIRLSGEVTIHHEHVGVARSSQRRAAQAGCD